MQRSLLQLALLLVGLWAGVPHLPVAHAFANGADDVARRAVEPTQPSARVPLVSLVSLHDTLQPLSAHTFAEQMQEAAAKHPAAILIDLSTPGGWEASAREMARTIAASPVPTVVFVRQPGTHVAGEGLRLLQAGTVAAMQPETRLLPLLPGRMRAGTGKEHVATREALSRDLRQSLAAQGRPTATVEELLAATDAISPTEALQAGLIDAVTPKDEDALRVLDARLAAKRAAESVRGAQAGNLAVQASASAGQDLANARVVALPMTSRQHLMRALMNPDLTVLLLTLGALLIFLEINTPGSILPGAAGVLLVLLSAYAFLQMSLRWEGVVLLAMSAALLFAEAQFARGSAVGVAAVVSLTLGLRLLVRGPLPELEVDWGTSIGAGVGFGGITAGLVLLGVRARRAKIRTGADAMLGWLAITQTPLQPAGEVLVRGELWHARLSDGNGFLPAGECVKVHSSEGVVLQVSPMPLTLQPGKDPVANAV